MSTELINGIISIATPTISLIILILTLFQSRGERNKGRLDSPSLKIYTVKRFPINKRYKFIIILKTYISIIILYIVFIIFNYISLSFISVNTHQAIIKQITIISTILVGIFGIALITYIVRDTISLSVDDLIYDAYQSVDIMIGADLQYLFNKGHEALRSMGFSIEEINEGAGYITSSYIPVFGITSTRKRLKMRIEQIEHAESTYLMRLEFMSRIGTYSRSKVTNRFIDLLISKS